MLGKIVTVTTLLCGFYTGSANARSLTRTFEQTENAPLFFKENYIVVEMVKNQPFSSSQEKLATGNNSVFVGFRHILRDHWLVGVHSGFKKFRLRDTNADLSIFTLLQETQLLYRLSHPLYFSAGPKLMFLLPTRGNKIPPKKEQQYTREVGLAGSLSLHYALNKYVILSLRVDRWRGVNTEKFQGTESGLGINIALP